VEFLFNKNSSKVNSIISKNDIDVRLSVLFHLSMLESLNTISILYQLYFRCTLNAILLYIN
jgi:hypothetical protein